jgi:hypothetical protein
VLVCSSVSAPAQERHPEVRATIRNVTRAESWSFFDPPSDRVDPTYTLLSNRATLGVHVNARRLAVEGSFQYAQLVGLPRRAVGPGPLGPGALFYAAARTPEAYQLYVKTLSARLQNVVPSLSVQIGRMTHESDEGTPFAGRLIGNAEWTPFERSFDGVRAEFARPTWRAHAAFVMPTQGAFEESASPTMGKVQVTTVGWSTKRAALFAHNYRDRRAVTARPDNTGLVPEQVHVVVRTFGASAQFAGVRFWGAVQNGEWFGDPHRAFSTSIDAGHQWQRRRWRPAIRGGLLHASGDRDPNDRRHGTFFPMLPTTRPDVLRGTFSHMNLRDVYVVATVEPRDFLSFRTEVHHLALAHRLDGWYSGTGATAFKGDYFGFSSRRSTLRTDLGTLLVANATARVRKQWTVNASAAVMRGGAVVRRQFDGNALMVLALESTVSLP